jgi:predicted alpha/beta-fold hydrolase
MHFRGCSGEPNRLARGYHSGETEDLAFVAETLQRREPKTLLAAVGYSLGGNVLLKWLGEIGGRAALAAAVAVSVPFDLKHCALRLESGFSRLYQWKLLHSLRHNTARKFSYIPCPVSLDGLDRTKTFHAFDALVTAPLHSFASADDYYTRSSSRQYLHNIGVPTLILQALDDPFMTPEVIPEPDDLSPTVTLELSEHGGHVGFVEGNWPWRPKYWLEKRIPGYLTQYLAT